ncbi:uncharacterized protein LOC116434822 isoform X2 [Nomia melanderi]|uniref:uncharacterized protein LOC116434822 isoform X2 n=1 Tax=Nomia melanderi TaxID=2448451 RepID=UPI001304220E|nr:SH3 domain-containing kinase-binding protein 1-like isoform X2 [Nomia melanderi]
MEAIVEYNYDAQEPDELTLKRGDIIQEITVMPGGWWKGTLRDKRGMFPDNFVKVLDPPSSKNTGGKVLNNIKSEEVSLRNGGSRKKFCKVLFDYEPCNKDELTLIPGDSIEFLGEEEKGWWRGRLKGKTGVFPSNFVTPPVYEDSDKYKDEDKKELCKVLFSYEAASEDELSLTEGDIITLLSRDAPDKGWWIGKLKGKVGLFPDNFVEIVTIATDHQDHEQRHDSKNVTKLSQPVTKSKKAHIRKSLDIDNALAETTKKIISRRTTQEESSGDVKTIGENSMVSNLKRLVGDVETNSGNGSTNASLAEELDGVERGEGVPLLHLTISRAKAPRRRPPSSQRLLRRVTGPTTMTPVNEDNVANENKETVLEQLREEEPEGLAAKARRKAPWVEELKLNQLERKKIALIDQLDKSNIKKDRNFINMTAMTFLEVINKLEAVDEESKSKNKNQKSDTSPHLEPTSPSSGTPAYVPYAVYNQLLERVATLEEKQATMLQTMVLILKQFVSLHYSGNSPTDQ